MPSIKSRTTSIHLKNKEPVSSEKPNGSFNNAAVFLKKLKDCSGLLDPGEKSKNFFLKIRIILSYSPKLVEFAVISPEKSKKGVRLKQLADLKSS